MERSSKRRRICDYYGTTTGPSCSHGMATSLGYDYEVFLSFRGKDTRAGFTDFLYTSLDSAGIRTFKDDEELRVGEEFAPELLQGIKQSKISIPIFSKGYASSVWCLKELVRMVECQKTGRQKIMPIFYDVSPAEVRHQTGGYGDAFCSHEKKKRYDEKTMQEWKDALSAVGDINGWDLHSQEENRQEGEFARKLTQKVFKELKKAHLAELDCLVNVDNHVDAIMEKIGAGTNKTRIIGIHGMGGIGKTTIAKIIYNKLADDFENHCFIRDIQETSKSKGIQCLQNQLISDILKVNYADIKDIDEGTQTIKDRLSNKKVLLLLDDVEEKKHIDAIVGNRDWLGKGSKIIITTRNKIILSVPKVDCDYELSGMDSKQSLQLFSKHAFRRDTPLDEYINQSKRAIDIAGGLPLALEVIGSLLSLIEKEKWDLKLKKLENVPNEKVRSKLKISYDVLDVGQQHIFLDIACFFIGYDKDIVIHFWDESKFPKEALEVLQNMSLIKIKQNNEMWMHDQLRDLGREIVRQESKMKIEKQSRVWDPQEGLNLLRRHKGKKDVEALRVKLDHQQPQCRFTYEGFENLLDLRFLELDNREEFFYVKGRRQRRPGFFNVEGRLLWCELQSDVPPTYENSDLLPQLRWLSWRNIPPIFNITNFFMEDVIFLDLSDSEITDNWKGWSHMKVMRNLKVLNLNSCTQLQRLPDELGRDLSSLERLSLRYCSSLERLPDSIGNLKSLIELDISSTKIKGLPNSIRNLKNLKVVKTWGDGIRKIPDALWTLGKLEEIQIFEHDSSFAGVFRVNVGKCVSVNKSLRILQLSGAKIYALPRLPESLIELSLSRLLMDTFPDLSNLANLEELHLKFHPHNSDGLVEYPMPQWIGNFSKLEALGLRDCYFVTTSPTDLSLPPQLKRLYLDCCPNLRRLPTLPSSLSSLSLEDCKSLGSMEDLSNLKKLSFLQIGGAAITEIQGLGCLENLQDLQLYSLRQVKILPDLSNLNKLTSLGVWFCDDLVEIQGELPRFLDSFQIQSCRSLEKLPNLSSLMGKQEVEIVECWKLNVEAILGYARKNSLDLQIIGFPQLHILPDLRNLRNSNELTSLQIQDCFHLIEIQGELPESLEILDISSCESLLKLPDLSRLMGLREVRISRCDSLDEIQGEQLPQSLEELEIAHYESLKKFPDLSRLMRLREVCIHSCGNLVEIQRGLPQSLEKLEIQYCKSLHNLLHLSSSMGLRDVCITGCGNLVEIQGELPQSLEVLEIVSCDSLQKLPDFSISMGLRKVEIRRCRKLNVKAISSLCLEKSVEFVGDDREGEESKSEGEDAESESEYEGEGNKRDREDNKSASGREDAESEYEE